MVKSFISFLIGFVVCLISVNLIGVPQDYLLALDHQAHEDAILQLETHLDSCEDAWQADVAECHMECQEAVDTLIMVIKLAGVEKYPEYEFYDFEEVTIR